MAPASRSMVREVNLTTARNLSPLFDEAVRGERPVMIVRGKRERGLLLSRDALLRVLAPYVFRVDLLPEDEGGFTLWIERLRVGATGATLKDARTALLSEVCAYVQDYADQFDFYRHLPELAAQEPYVLKLSLAGDDAELIEMLFVSRALEHAAA